MDVSSRVVRDFRPIPVPQDRREAARWALRVAPAGLAFGLAVGWLIGRWLHR
jgi:hypothetical protein